MLSCSWLFAAKTLEFSLIDASQPPGIFFHGSRWTACFLVVKSESACMFCSLFSGYTPSVFLGYFEADSASEI
jgi:hypothetical protein